MSEFKTEPRAHRQTLQALRETQLEQGRDIAVLRADLTELSGETRRGFATVLAAVKALATRLPEDPAAGPEVPAAR